MKKINLLLLGVLVLFAGFFASCTKDDTTNDAVISLAGDAGFTAGDANVTAGGSFTVKWTATSSIDMKYISIYQDNAVYGTYSQKEIDSDYKSTYIDQATINVPASGGPYTYAIVIYDKDKNELARKEIKITLTAAAGQINSYNLSMGGGSNTTVGSYLDAETGTVYTSAQVNASTTIIKPSIDIIFDNSKLYNVSSTVITSSTGTKFATSSITASQFDAMTDDSGFSALTASLDNVTIATGNVVFFQTVGGKKGLIKVGNVDTQNSLLTATEKIQK